MLIARFGLMRCVGVLAIAAWFQPCGSAAAGGDETIRFRFIQIPAFTASDEVGPFHRERLVLKGTSAKEWTECLEVLSTKRKGPYKDSGALAAALRAQLHQGGCKVVRDTTLASDGESVFWSVLSDSCAPAGSEFSMTRVLSGKKTLWVMTYTSRDLGVTTERRQQIADVLQSAKVEKQ